MEELRFDKGQYARDLAALLREGYRSGMRPVKIAFEANMFAHAITGGTANRNVVRSPNVESLSLMEFVLHIAGLPKGRIYSENHPTRQGDYSAYLVYEPLPRSSNGLEAEVNVPIEKVNVEFEILHHLFAHPGRVVTKRELSDIAGCDQSSLPGYVDALNKGKLLRNSQLRIVKTEDSSLYTMVDLKARV